jgi:hypothetical protein
LLGHIGQVYAAAKKGRKPCGNLLRPYEEGRNYIVPDLHLPKFFPARGSDGQYEILLPFFAVPDDQGLTLDDGFQQTELGKGPLREEKPALIYEHPAAVVFEPSGFEFPFICTEPTEGLDRVNVDGGYFHGSIGLFGLCGSFGPS